MLPRTRPARIARESRLPTICADERPQTYALDRAATGTGRYLIVRHIDIDIFY
jgi:hypothetical protein